MRTYEDFKAGDVFELGPRTVTRAEIVEFAAQFDPQPMHLDEAAGARSLLGGLAASGWHVCSIVMRMLADSVVLDSASMGAPGVDEVRWILPVRPGDALTLRTIVLETRDSKSRPDRGFVRIRTELRNQTGAVAMTMETPLMMGRRAGAVA